MLQLTARTVVVGTMGGSCSFRTAGTKSEDRGRVSGDPVGNRVGERVLADGGNAIDAAVAASLATCITAPSRSGIGGYGGHMTIALAGGKKVTSIDFNSIAPAAAREDMYPLDENGAVKGRIHLHGWLAVGVPGTMAGLQLALDRYGTRSFRELVQPAIQFARDGYVLTAGQAGAIRGALAQFKHDPGSARLYLVNDGPPQEGLLVRNPDLAGMLTTLAERNSVDLFYRGDIGHTIAEAIRKNGGLVTAVDMAAYQAREVSPLELRWNDFRICTAPLTAGGLTTLQALTILKTLRWERRGPPATHMRLEALRAAWKDRLDLLGDPERTSVPVEHLLSVDHARDLAEKIELAVKTKKPLPLAVPKNAADGTTNISAVDRHGNLVAITFTHGGTFGAQVTVDGLGLTLGHGMSRFNPRPGHPNSPGPYKRPLHNMCPTVVLRGGKPVLAVGARGGVKIPNTVFDVLTPFVAHGRSMEEAVAAPRLHCMGTLDVTMEKTWPQSEQDYLKRIGFQVTAGPGAHASAVSFNPRTGECGAAER